MLQIVGTFILSRRIKMSKTDELELEIYREYGKKNATSLEWHMNGSKIRIVQSFQRLLTNYIETKKGNAGNISFLLNKHN